MVLSRYSIREEKTIDTQAKVKLKTIFLSYRKLANVMPLKVPPVSGSKEA